MIVELSHMWLSSLSVNKDPLASPYLGDPLKNPSCVYSKWSASNADHESVLISKLDFLPSFSYVNALEMSTKKWSFGGLRPHKNYQSSRQNNRRSMLIQNIYNLPTFVTYPSGPTSVGQVPSGPVARCPTEPFPKLTYKVYHSTQNSMLITETPTKHMFFWGRQVTGWRNTEISSIRYILWSINYCQTKTLDYIYSKTPMIKTYFDH